MAWTERKKAEAFNLDTALNTKGFAEFLAKYPDEVSPDAANEATIRERMEVFTQLGEVKKKLQGFYEKEIFRTHKVKLETKDFDALGAAVEEKAINDPEYFQKITEKIEANDEARAKAEVREARLKKLTGRERVEGHDDLKRALETISKRGGGALRDIPGIGYFFRSGEEQKAYEALKKSHGGAIRAKLALGVAEYAEENLEKVLDSARAERDSIFSEFAVTKGLFDSAFSAVEARMGNILNGEKTFEKVQEAHDYAEFLKWMESEEGVDGVSELGGLDKLQAHAESAVKMRLAEEIDAAIARAPMGRNALTNLEKALERTMKREKVGSNRREEAQAMIREALEAAAEKTTDKAKRILLRRMLIKTEEESTTAESTMPVAA